MTIPDKLIEAVTDSVIAQWALFRAPTSGGTELVRSEYEEVLRSALAAAFAALPEVDELRAEDHGDAWGEAHSCGWNEALATLARMAQP